MKHTIYSEMIKINDISKNLVVDHNSYGTGLNIQYVWR